jgi:cytochrome c oxidase assembly protein subunit 15
MSTSTEALPARRIESPQDGSAVVAWLWTIYLLIFLMVLIGGTTRLTGSGLSMVDWHPLMGAIPPLNEQEWQNVFLRYQEFPQYRLVNSWMDLGAFQKIFFWEYLHRLLGRLIGVAVFLPWLYFLLTKRLTRTTSAGALLAIFLGGSQGFLGTW